MLLLVKLLLFLCLVVCLTYYFIIVGVACFVVDVLVDGCCFDVDGSMTS